MTPHRIDDQERVRRGHFDRLDPEQADAAMRRNFDPEHTPGRATRLRKDDWRDGYTNPKPEVNPLAHEHLARDMKRTAIVPTSLRIACPTCGTAAGEYCTTEAKGICGARVRAS